MHSTPADPSQDQQISHQRPSQPQNTSIMDPTIEQLTSELDTRTAQRDNYISHCTSLETQLKHYQAQLSSKFQTSQCNVDPAIFNGESLERLREWRRCLDFMIEEAEEKGLDEKGKAKTEGEEEKGGEQKARKIKFQGELPFSPMNLAGFLTKNHRLTQGRTEYPEPKPKQRNPQP